MQLSAENSKLADNAEEMLQDSLQLFEEPPDFRPPSPQPTVTHFVKKSTNEKLIVNLPAKHSLWAHRLWNAGQSLTHYLDENRHLYVGKNVLELGAAASLPSLIAAMNGARLAVSTDYPDPQLINNIIKNANDNNPALIATHKFVVAGFIWGGPAAPILDMAPEKFDLILLADLIFNHSEHQNMLKSCKELLAPNGLILTTFSHHVPKWADRDLLFFEHAAQYGFLSEKLYEQDWDEMFPDDVGDVEIRRKVHCYKLWSK